MTEEKKLSSEEMGVVLYDKKEIEKQYPEKEYNLVLPSATIQKMSPFFKTTLEVISIREDETYEVPGGKGRRAIHKVGLDKFSNARGINWPADKNRLVGDEGSPEKVVRFQATGEARRDDGTWLERSATYALDLNEIKKEIHLRHAERADLALRGPEKDLPAGLTKATRDSWVEKQTEKDMVQKRKYRVQLAESGASNRVINKFLTLKGTYTKEELKKPFVFPRNIFIPDIQDPTTRSMIVTEASRASSQLYGGGAPPRTLPILEGHVVNGHSPEVEAELEPPVGEKPPAPITPARTLVTPPPAPAPAPAAIPSTPATPPAPAPSPAPEAEKPAPEAPAPAPEPELSLEELFPTYDAQAQSDVIKQLMKAVGWAKPLKNPDIQTWESKHRIDFFGVLMAAKKKKEEAEKPY